MVYIQTLYARGEEKTYLPHRLCVYVREFDKRVNLQT